MLALPEAASPLIKLFAGRFPPPPISAKSCGSTCGSIASGSSRAVSRCSAKKMIAAKHSSPLTTTMMMAFGGVRPRGAATQETAALAGAGAAAAAAAGGLPAFWSAPRAPSRRTVSGRRGGAALLAVAKAAGGGDPEDSVLEKKAEFYGNSAPGAVAPEGAEKQDEAAVDYAVKRDWEKSLQLIEAMR